MERNSTRVLIMVAVALLVLPRVFAFISVNSIVLGYPYQFDYTEGIVWQQAALMFSPLAYGPIDGFPAIVFEYAPVFHVVVRAVSAVTKWDMLLIGRVVSLAATAAIVFTLGHIIRSTARQEKSALIPIMLAAALVTTSTQLTFIVSLMRVDMLALAFALAGFYFGVVSIRQPKAIFIASALFLFAVFTKQNTIAAPAAVFALLAWLRPRTAMIGVLTCVGVGLVILTLLSVATDGRFVEHIFLYNLNRIDLSRLKLLASIVLGSHLPLFIAAMLILREWRREAGLSRLPSDASQLRLTVRSDPALSTRVALGAYFTTSSASLLGILKSGANDNYTVEFLLVLAAIAGSALFEIAQLLVGRSAGGEASGFLGRQQVFISLLVLAPLLVTPVAQLDREIVRERRMGLDSLVSRVSSATRPVVSDEMSVVLRAGKAVEIEPAIFAELASTGRWSEKQFLQRIARREFEMFITENSPDNTLFKWRYSSAVQSAVRSAYPTRQAVAGYTLHLPRPEP